MNKTISTKKKPIFPILIGALVLTTVGYFASIPLLNKFEHDRFAKLDNQIQTIFQKLKIASNGADKWEYETDCTAELAGDWSTGQYFCTAQILMDKTITSVNDLNNLQTKYYPIIDTDTTLNQVTDLDPQLPNDFGKNFVVGSAYKKYKETKSNAVCNYSIDLYQNSNNADIPYEKNVSYGSKINNEIGSVRISLSCTAKANSDWYSIKK